jgi:putative membrane protein
MRGARALDYLSGLPAFAAYFGLALLLFLGFIAIYVRITPYPEIRLIREGNTAAAASLGGALIGFALPLASAVENSVSLLDMLIWAAVALIVQLIAFGVARLMVRDVTRQIQEGKVSAGVFVGALAVAIGLLNAASMSY